ncbi:MAG: hypothetical protein WA395_04690 [Nitrososphaeraceae archaeon]
MARIRTEGLTQVTYAAGEFTARTSIEFKIVSERKRQNMWSNWL